MTATQMHNQYANMPKIQWKQSQAHTTIFCTKYKYVYWLNYHQFRAIKMSAGALQGEAEGLAQA